MGKPEIIKSIRDILDKYVAEKKLRKTQERYRILEFIYDLDKHFDVDELYRKLKESGFSVSKATVYNTLELLLDAGLVRKHYFNNQAAYYEKSYFNSAHDHLIVLGQDGRVEQILEFCDPRIDAIRSDLEQQLNLNISDHDLYFYAKKTN